MGRFIPRPMVCKVGDHVRWLSTSRGVPRHHSGVVVGVVPPGKQPREAQPFPLGFKAWQFRPGSTRPLESYLVAYGGKLYWPRVLHLRPY